MPWPHDHPHHHALPPSNSLLTSQCLHMWGWPQVAEWGWCWHGPKPAPLQALCCPVSLHTLGPLQTHSEHSWMNPCHSLREIWGQWQGAGEGKVHLLHPSLQNSITHSLWHTLLIGCAVKWWLSTNNNESQVHIIYMYMQWILAMNIVTSLCQRFWHFGHQQFWIGTRTICQHCIGNNRGFKAGGIIQS